MRKITTSLIIACSFFLISIFLISSFLASTSKSLIPIEETADLSYKLTDNLEGSSGKTTILLQTSSSDKIGYRPSRKDGSFLVAENVSRVTSDSTKLSILFRASGYTLFSSGPIGSRIFY